MSRKPVLPVALLAAVSFAGAVPAQDAYVIGLSGALTGPQAGTYAPTVEGVKLYVDRVNARGGVNGKPIRLLVQDNQGEPSKAAADAKKFTGQDNVLLMMNVSLSSTYAPMVAETRRARVPLLYTGAVCPPEVYPPNPDPMQFCSTAFSTNHDAQFAMQFIKERSGEAVRLGLVAMAIPISRAGIDIAEARAKALGMTPVDKQIVPPPTPDYTPFATKLQSAGPNWVFSWAPWVTEIKTFEALRRLGWNGSYVAYALAPAEDELARVRDGAFYVLGAQAFFRDDLPAHREMRAAAAKASIAYPVTQIAEGWVGGMVLEQALKNTPWPPSAGKVQAAMNRLKVDTGGLRGAPIAWNKNNHFRARQHYRVYRWDPAKQSVERVKDWTEIEIK